MVHTVDQCGDAKYIGQQNEFLSQIRAGLPHFRQKHNCLHPFLRSDACLSDEIMQVLDQGFEDELLTGILT